MKKISLQFILIFFAFLSADPFAATVPEKLADSVVEVIVTHQEYDPLLPWQKTRPHTRHGYGVFTGKSELLTNESLIRNHTLVEIRRSGSGEKITVQVGVSDPSVDLALLHVPETDHEFKPLAISSKVKKDDTVMMAQFSGSDEIQYGAGKVFEISVQSLPNAPYRCLIFKVLTDLNVNAAGTIVMNKDKIAGLVLSYNSSSRTAKVIPYPIIKRFLQDADKEPFHGFASAGFIWSKLVDPAKKAYLGVKEEKGGIMVLACIPGMGAYDTLKPGDVILELNGNKIDQLGYYDDPDFGKILISHLIHGKARVGDSIPVVLVRDSERKAVSLPLTRGQDQDRLIPENYQADPPGYVVEGGFVIRELTGRYLRAYGRNWKKRLPSKIVHLYMTKRHTPENIYDKVVVISQVLPDPVNIGYHQFGNAILTNVNNVPVKNMQDVFKAMKKKGHITTLRIDGMDVDIALDKQAIEEANIRLARKYRIPALRREKFQANDK